MRAFRTISAALALLAITGLAVPQEVKIGGAKLTGMAGAGLALPYEAGQAVPNPAVFARKRHQFKFNGPSLDYYTRGLSLSQVLDIYKDREKSGLDVEGFGQLARDVAGRKREFGIEGIVGAHIAGFHIGYRAEGSAALMSNDALKAWKEESGDPAELLTTYSDAAMDGYGYAYEAVEFAYGVPIQGKGGTVNVGAKVRNIKAYYSHYVADAATIESEGAGAPGAEMGGEDVLSKSGTALDIGLNFTPQNQSNLHFGAVIENVIEPSVGFQQAGPGIVGLRSFNPFERAFSTGIAFTPDKRIIAAVDYVDMFDTANRAALRLGAQYRFADAFAISAGYNSRDTWIVAAQVWGVNVSLTGDQKLRLGQGLKF